MPDIAALEKHACAACGAQAEWNPSKQLLICPFCGTSTPFTIDKESGALVENDLAKALRDLPDEARGWLAEKRTVQCQSCKAVSVFDPERVGQNCQFCGSPSLVDYKEIKAPIRPQGLLPFKVSESQVREQIRRWYASKWLAPGKLKSRALVDSAYAGSTFRIGRSMRRPSVHGKRRPGTTTTRRKPIETIRGARRRARFSTCGGSPPPASSNISSTTSRCPVRRAFHTCCCVRWNPLRRPSSYLYDTAFLSGFIVEHYQVVLVEAAQASQDAMVQKLRDMCAAQIPGDTYRNLSIHPTFSAQTFKHILVPVWLLAYLYGTRMFQVVVNGYSGRMAGQYPKSPWKIAFLVLLAIIAFFIFVMLSQNN